MRLGWHLIEKYKFIPDGEYTLFKPGTNKILHIRKDTFEILKLNDCVQQNHIRKTFTTWGLSPHGRSVAANLIEG